MIPLVDLAAAHAEVAEEVEAGFKRVIAGTAFIGGTEVTAFEEEYAAFSEIEHCVGLANGTDAVELALRAVGVGPGSEVILPANTFIATAEAVARAGGRVVLVDCDPTTYLIDVDAALAAVTPATRAIVPVHLYGQLAEVERLREGLAGRDVAIVEDAAQCQGATRHGRGAGAGGIAATSFYPGKNLGAYGEGGMVVTNDPDLARTVAMLRDWGQEQKYVHRLRGYNYRLETLQGAILRVKLRHLPAWTAARRERAARYDRLLAGCPLERPVALPGRGHVYHVYAVRVRHREAVRDALARRSIHTGIHYPVPVHLQPAYADLGYGVGAFPHTEAAAAAVLSLPLYPELTDALQDRVVAALREVLA
jgi:dTDP-4-amino-4,6-dideoxygalactose transaminase